MTNDDMEWVREYAAQQDGRHLLRYACLES
jgi:hypothetical protein